jgi:hypothetical protein
MRGYLRLALIAFVIFFLIKSPHSAAHIVHRAMSGLSAAGSSLSAFVSSI